MQSKRFQGGENFAYSTVSAATTCSFTLSASVRHVLFESLQAWSDVSGAVVTVQASGTTLWSMKLGSNAVPANFNGLSIDNGGAQSISCLITASSLGAYIGVCGTYKLI